MGDERGIQFCRTRHGGLYDRGRADSYYGRKPDPHWYPNGTYNEPKVTDLTDAEIAEYMAGHVANTREGNFKDWGGEDDE